MIKHIVFWNFAESAEGASKEENMGRAARGLLALKESIPEIVEIEVGRDFNQSTAAYEMALYTVFRSQEDLRKYQVHPEHEKMKQFIGAVTTGRAVVDYEL